MILVRGCQESVGGTELNFTSLVMLTLLASCPRCVDKITPSTSQLARQITVESHLHTKSPGLESNKLWHETGWRWQPCPSTFPHKTLWTTEKPQVTDNLQQVTVSSRIPDYDGKSPTARGQQVSTKQRKESSTALWPIRLQNSRHRGCDAAKERKIFF